MASNEEVQNEQMRNFATGATRNIDTEREDPEGFFAPSVLASYIAYMHKNRFQKDGKLRDSDNWQLGIPQRAYMKSFWRHFFDLWTEHRKGGNHLTNGREEATRERRIYTGTEQYQNPNIIEDCNALIFNAMGYLFEELKKPKQGSMEHFVRDFPATFVTGRVRSQMLEDHSAEEETEPGYGNGV